MSCTECHRRKQKCDRLQPCANCSKREKPHLCIYEHSEQEQGSRVRDQYSEASLHPFSELLDLQTTLGSQESPSATSFGKDISEDMGYSLDSSTGTLGLIRLAEAQKDPMSSPFQQFQHREEHLTIHYKKYIRQLPSQKHIEALTRIFFTDVAWYYDIIDENSFLQQLHSWNAVPYPIITQDPSKLPPDLRPFPALLFQVLAQALLLLPTNPGGFVLDLKHRPDMSFADLATEYSEAGHEILVLLGSKGTTLNKVQAGLFRASFQKSTGFVVEAWHTLGATIRDAQEIGLHRPGSAQHTTSVNAISGSVEHLRDLEIRTRLWLVLHLWDGHMAVVLGRPMVTRVNHDMLISLLDSIEASKNDLAGAVAGGQEHPPFAFIVEGYRAAYRYLQDIHDLESSGLPRVDKHRTIHVIHATIVQNIRRLPEWVKVDTTESSRQSDSSDSWLPAARETLFTELHFVLLALHRPYIFSVPRSREEAHNAALRILASQSRLFHMSESREYQPFNIIFATFDAMVLIEASYILFPHENESRQDTSVNNIRWGLERLDRMRGNNQLAASAYNVVHSLYWKMMSRIHPGSYPAPSSDETHIPSMVQENMGYLFSDIPQGDTMDVSSSHTQEQIHDLEPPQPLHDLITQSFPSDDWQQLQLTMCPWPQQTPLQVVSTEDIWYPLNELMD